MIFSVTKKGNLFYVDVEQDEYITCQVQGGTGVEWARVEWNYSGMDGV